MFPAAAEFVLCRVLVGEFTRSPLVVFLGLSFMRPVPVVLRGKVSSDLKADTGGRGRLGPDRDSKQF